MGPHLIDKLGRVVADLEREAHGKDSGNRVRQELAGQKFYRPGQIGAMVADYKNHDVYMSLADKTQLEYRVYLDKFVDKFGETHWRRLSPGSLRSWLREYGAANVWAGMHSLYRTIRAFFGKVASASPRSTQASRRATTSASILRMLCDCRRTN